MGTTEIERMTIGAIKIAGKNIIIKLVCDMEIFIMEMSSYRIDQL